MKKLELRFQLKEATSEPGEEEILEQATYTRFISDQSFFDKDLFEGELHYLFRTMVDQVIVHFRVVQAIHKAFSKAGSRRDADG